MLFAHAQRRGITSPAPQQVLRTQPGDGVIEQAIHRRDRVIELALRLARVHDQIVDHEHRRTWGDVRLAASDARYRIHQPSSEEHTSELQSLMRISYADFCFKKKNQ